MISQALVPPCLTAVVERVTGKRLSSSERRKNKLKMRLSKFLPGGPPFLFLGQQQQQSPLLADNIQECHFSLGVDS